MTREEEIWKAAMLSSGKRDRIGGFYNGAKWADEHPKNPWISVEERLPEESREHRGWLSDTVFVVTNKGDGTSARYDIATKTWCPAKILQGSITHWMPILQIKKGEE